MSEKSTYTRVNARTGDESQRDDGRSGDSAGQRWVRPGQETEETEETADEELVCPECGGNVVTDDEHGETICSDCGLVITEDSVDRGPEWRAFDAKEKDQKSRVGAPTTNTMHDKGLSTNIDWRDRDAYGNSLSSNQRQKMQRLRKWNERFRTRDSKERNLKQALGEIDRMASALGLPENVRHLPPRARRGSPPRPLHRGRRDLVCLRRRPDGGRAAVARRDRGGLPRAEKRDRPHLPVHRAGALVGSQARRPRAVRPPVRLRTRPLRRGEAPGATAPEERQGEGGPLGEVAGGARRRRGLRRRAAHEREDDPGRGQRGRRHLRGHDQKPVPRAAGSRREHRSRVEAPELFPHV